MTLPAYKFTQVEHDPATHLGRRQREFDRIYIVTYFIPDIDLDKITTADYCKIYDRIFKDAKEGW